LKKKNSKIHVAMVGQKFLDSIGNKQGNSPEMALPCPQISSNDFTYFKMQVERSSFCGLP